MIVPSVRVSQEWLVEAIPSPGLSLDELEQRLLAQGVQILRKDPERNRILVMHVKEEQ